MKRLSMGWWLVVGMAILVLAPVAGAQVKVEEADKDIVVSPRPTGLEVKFSSNKKSYKVNEPISFKIKVNKAAYVYLFQVNEKTETVTMLFPNNYESENKVKPNKQMVIPKQSQFRSNRAGTEQVVLLASMTPLELRTGKSAGAIYKEYAKSTLDEVVKDIRVEPRGKEDRVAKELEIAITGGRNESRIEPSNVVPGGKAAVVLSTDKVIYGLNEPMTINYAADADGYIVLYGVNPEGKLDYLKGEQVKKNLIYRLKATTASPSGPHYIVALFDKREIKPMEGKTAATHLLSRMKGESKTKDIVVAVQPEACAVYAFQIQ